MLIGVGRKRELMKSGQYKPIFPLPTDIPGERWLPITEDMVPNISDGYFISDHGRTYGCKKGIGFLQQAITNGYYSVRLCDKNGIAHTRGVHRLVLLAFNPILNSNKMQVDHIDGNKLNNNNSNLEWCSPKENVRRAHVNGLCEKKERRPKTTTDEQVISIANSLAAVENPRFSDIARENDVDIGVVRNIAYGRTHKDVYDEYHFSERNWIEERTRNMKINNIQKNVS